MRRKPLALTNWKMAMTASESVAFIREFTALVGALLDQVDVVVCPPYTTLWQIKQNLGESRIELGGQNMAPTSDPARTGEISADLLLDVGCRWVMLGHWEVRRHLADSDEIVNRKLHLALEAGLLPIVFIGEARDKRAPFPDVLDRQLRCVLAGCREDRIATMAFVYEPEGVIGVDSPASPEHVATGCTFIRGWLRRRLGEAVAGSVRIIYGGSVTPSRAAELLACPDVDGLGATRRGRNAVTFAEIVRQIARAKT
ncbi:MAG TPA: triose-phosphate isomerase [Planctomycetaceae bacterium]|nr:triose-phosphate isomerase [Planctomycetaceae bacterium]